MSTNPEHTIMSDLKRPRIPRLLNAMHRDEAGTTLTELVVVLPIFVFMFSGILRIYKYEDLSVQAYATSYAQAMDQHRNLQTSLMPSWSINSATAAIDAGAWHAGAHGGFDLAADGLLTTPIGFGHMTEMRSRLYPAGSESELTEDAQLEPRKLFSTVNGLTAEYMPEAQRNLFGAGDGHTDFTRTLFNDRISPGSLGSFEASSPGAALNSAMTFAGARPALAAGMRYGITRGKVDMTHPSWMGQQFLTQTAAHGAAPPRPTSRFITFGVVRLNFQGDEAYDNDILAFETRFNTGSENAECISSLEGLDLNESNIEANDDLIEEIADGGGCASSSGNSAGGFFDGFFNIINNAAATIGGPVPTNTTSGRYDQRQF